MKRFTAHDKVANLPGHAWKSKVPENFFLNGGNRAPLTSKQIQANLRTQVTTVSVHAIRHYLNVKGHCGM